MMMLQNQAICRRCGQGMETVAEIPPMGRGPGLRAFLCADCGETESALVYPSQAGHQGRGDQSRD
jgi:hypothetical protein